jgi:hypothetical protein
MSNLVNHAKHELELLNEDPETVRGYLKVIQAFASARHSGGSAVMAMMVINRLLHFKNLTPLTNDPFEWEYHNPVIWGDEKGIWQNRRNSEAFSSDGGQTYRLLSEDTGRRWWQKRKVYRSQMTIPFKFGELDHNASDNFWVYWTE